MAQQSIYIFLYLVSLLRFPTDKNGCLVGDISLSSFVHIFDRRDNSLASAAFTNMNERASEFHSSLPLFVKGKTPYKLMIGSAEF